MKAWQAEVFVTGGAMDEEKLTQLPEPSLTAQRTKML
jgi:hypothetical protein